MTEPRRHAVYFSDRQIGIIERALRTHASVMRIQTAAPSPQEADDTARTAAVIQGHLHCDCPNPSGLPPQPLPYRKPIEDRKVVKEI